MLLRISRRPRLGGAATGSRAVSAAIGLCLLAGCASVQQVKTLVTGPSSPYLSGYIGEVVADEPRAALVARGVLARGGNAADAAAALGMSLAVTLPSRASLGAGGACLAFDAASRTPPDAVLFMPVGSAAAAGAGSMDRPASVPMLARGMFLLQASHGSVGFDELVRPAADMARNGITVSRALADDLAEVRGPLLADAQARAIFGNGGDGGDGALAAGDRLVQPQLAATLDRIVSLGVADLYTGALAADFLAGANAAGGGLDSTSIRDALPISRKPLSIERGPVRVAFLPPPADGGLAAAAAFAGLQDHDQDIVRRSNEVAASWRAGHPGNDAGPDLTEAAQAALSAPPGAAPALGALPASTSFVVLDRSGDAVACAISMDNLFGTGRVAGDTGIVLAASPARVMPPLLAAAIAWRTSGHDFRAAVAGSGQNDAAASVAAGMQDALDSSNPTIRPVTRSGRANIISCPAGLPGDSASCRGATDPRGAGLAIGSD